MGEGVDTGNDEREREQFEAELLERREAALAHVVKFGDPVLKSKASPVGEFGPELRAEIERMVGIMRDGMGVGLAATQLGVLRRLLVFQASNDSEPTALVNPEIAWLSGELGLYARDGVFRVHAGPYPDRVQADRVASRIEQTMDLRPVLFTR